ncbi:hypothetical protein JCM17960_30350 [Magnetospira thiophila]
MNAPFPLLGDIVVYDLEFTAWPGSMEFDWSRPGEYREIVQIGAVRLDGRMGLTEKQALTVLCHPIKNPQLSAYFTNLTGITQPDLDAEGVSFPSALQRFLDFGAGAGAWVANGHDYDILCENCALHRITVPQLSAYDISNWISAKLEQPEHVDSHTLSVSLNLSPQGRAHDGLADARTIAAALRRMLGIS